MQQRQVTTSLESQIEVVTKHLSVPYFGKLLRDLAKSSPRNARTIVEHILAEQTQYNAKASTVEGKIKRLVWLSRFLNNKPFGKMSRQDILLYLNSRKKPLEVDPKQKWIGFYNSCRIVFSKFFRWYYNQGQSDTRLWQTPDCMKGIRQLPKPEISPYLPSDLWTKQEHEVFLRYCPDIRDRAFHAMADDMSARPHEILALKIDDIKFRVSSEGIHYAEVLIHGGKTKPRTLPLIDSIPFVRELIQQHPTGANKNSWLFVAKAHQSFGQKLDEPSLWDRYVRHYRDSYFPRLLYDDTVPEPDKSIIKNLLAKPWNPYIFRHTALTEKSQVLPEFPFRDHGGWSPTSKMPRVYLHYYGVESAKKLLELRGIVHPEAGIAAKPRTKGCTSCGAPNRTDSRFCTACKMVLSYDAYHEEVSKRKESDQRIERLEAKMALLEDMRDHPEKYNGI